MWGRFWPFERTFQPSFDGRRLARSLRRSCPELALPARTVRGDATDDLAAVARYFRTRSRPRFFIEPDAVAGAVETVDRLRPEWRITAVESARAWLHAGLPIYASLAPPLRADFPWGGLPAGPGADKLYCKRPHRFAFLPRLALATLYEPELAGALGPLLEGWMKFVRTPARAIAYDSNLAVIQRVLASSWAWIFLAGRSDAPTGGDALEGSVLQILSQDVRFLAPRLGRSYPNNHLLADLFAGWYIGTLWPEFAPAADWRSTFEPRWLQELERQLLPDGTSFEHSLHYHEFACEMTVAYVLLSRRNGYPVADWVEQRLEAALRFQADLAGPEALQLRIGDSVEEPMFPLDGGDGWGSAAWRELHRLMFDSDLAPAAPSPSAERAFWLSGGQLGPTGQRRPSARSRAYHCGGFHLFSEPDETARLVFRSGPSADNPICAGHAHADLLSIYCAVGGRPVIVDAGTYTYRSRQRPWPGGTPDWRGYFVGPRAHNGLALADFDPLGLPAGDFREAEARVRVRVIDAVDATELSWVEAEFDGGGGYSGYRRGVVHVSGEYWLVYDRLPEGAGEASYAFQLAADVEATIEAGGVVCMTCRGMEQRLLASDGLAPAEIFCGSTSPPAGWVAAHYGELAAAPQLRYAVLEHKPTAFLIEIGTGSAPAALEVDEQNGCVRFRFRRGQRNDLLMLGGGTADILDHAVHSDARVCWISCDGARPRAIRIADGSRCSAAGLALDIRADSRVDEVSVRDDGAGIDQRVVPERGISVVWPTET